MCERGEQGKRIAVVRMSDTTSTLMALSTSVSHVCSASKSILFYFTSRQNFPKCTDFSQNVVRLGPNIFLWQSLNQVIIYCKVYSLKSKGHAILCQKRCTSSWRENKIWRARQIHQGSGVMHQYLNKVLFVKISKKQTFDAIQGIMFSISTLSLSMRLQTNHCSLCHCFEKDSIKR